MDDPLEPGAVQALVLCDQPAVREHRVPGHHPQHHLPRHEVLPPARVVHGLPRRRQPHFHFFLRRRVLP